MNQQSVKNKNKNTMSNTTTTNNDNIIVRTNGYKDTVRRTFSKSDLFGGLVYHAVLLNENATIDDIIKEAGGKSALLDIVNADRVNQFTSKARNIVAVMVKGKQDTTKTLENRAALLAKAEAAGTPNVVFSADEAEQWNPEVREVSLDTELKRLKKAKADGTMSTEEVQSATLAILRKFNMLA